MKVKVGRKACNYISVHIVYMREEENKNERKKIDYDGDDDDEKEKGQ